MLRVPYHNDSDQTVFIGGVLIPPHDTREVDPTLLSDYQPAVADETAPALVTVVDHLLKETERNVIRPGA